MKIASIAGSNLLPDSLPVILGLLIDRMFALDADADLAMAIRPARLHRGEALEQA